MNFGIDAIMTKNLDHLKIALLKTENRKRELQHEIRTKKWATPEETKRLNTLKKLEKDLEALLNYT